MNETPVFSSRDNLWTWLANPFHFVAGVEALGAGVAVLLLAGINGSVSHSHFSGVLDFQTGMAAPRWLFVSEGFIAWLAAAFLLWLAGLLISNSRIRAIDVFGTLALARFPMLGMAFAALFPGYQRQAARFASHDFQSVPADLVVFAVTVAILLAMTLWMLLLMYRAFAVSCNVKGIKALAAFIITITLAEIISKTVLMSLMFRILG